MEMYLRSISIAIIILSLGSVFMDISSLNSFAQTNAGEADWIIQSKSLTLPPNVKHLVILIPNEGHHGPNEEDESRFIAQPFLPQNAIIGPGTQVVWFSGDVGHDHNIVVREANSTIFETGQFPEFGVTRPITFNNSGTFDYADTVDYEEGFRMTGKITVLDDNGQRSNVAARTTTNNTAADTVGVLMVPAEDSQDIAQTLMTAGFGIDSVTTFQDLRTAQEEVGGDQQALLVWTTSGKTMNEITPTLQQIADELPYG
jgi:plastocyanin